jgi:hypothetical protein
MSFLYIMYGRADQPAIFLFREFETLIDFTFYLSHLHSMLFPQNFIFTLRLKITMKLWFS